MGTSVNPSSLRSAATQSMELDDEPNKAYSPELEQDEDGNDIDWDDAGNGSEEPVKPADDLFDEPAPKTAAQMKADAKERKAGTAQITEAIACEHQEREKARSTKGEPKIWKDQNKVVANEAAAVKLKPTEAEHD